MSNKAVADALAAGADPAMLCETCPWDRFCITPPSMTREDIDRMQKEAEAKEREKEGDKGFPVGSLLTAIVFGGKDTQAELCPVFALRLRSSEGQNISAILKSYNQKVSD